LLTIPIASRKTKTATPSVSKSFEIKSNIVYPFCELFFFTLNPTILFGIVHQNLYNKIKIISVVNLTQKKTPSWWAVARSGLGLVG
jgi:hypothetical protein